MEAHLIVGSEAGLCHSAPVQSVQQLSLHASVLDAEVFKSLFSLWHGEMMQSFMTLQVSRQQYKAAVLSLTPCLSAHPDLQQELANSDYKWYLLDEGNAHHVSVQCLESSNVRVQCTMLFESEPADVHALWCLTQRVECHQLAGNTSTM